MTFTVLDTGDHGETTRFRITRPDDFHLHLRDGEAMCSVLLDSAGVFQRALIMPNLKPPVTTVALASAYRARILSALPRGSRAATFEPLMTLYLTDATSPNEIARAERSGFIIACKLYPAGATTNSQDGVTDISRIYPALAAMERHGLVLSVHGEVTDSTVDIYDREAYFIERVLIPLRGRFPGLRIVLEHISTEEAVTYVTSADAMIAATITLHHLRFDRNALFAGGLNPHYHCMPILKRARHHQALIQAATSGHPRIFLGTDSAPHEVGTKECASGCAGCYTAHGALEGYTEVFENAGVLHLLENFASQNGTTFYSLPPNTETIVLQREDWIVPESRSFGAGVVKPLLGGHTLRWKVVPS